MSTVTKIGLFPLNLILFPGSQLPLHIFESRYKRLIADVMTDDTVFGMNNIDSLHINPVGCTARVERILRRYEDGRLDIVVRGEQRYRISATFEDRKSYLTAEVEFFDDVDEDIDLELRNATIEMFNTMVKIVYASGVGPIDPAAPEDAIVSFHIGEKAGLAKEKKQELLEMRSENERLKFLHDFISSYLPELEHKKRITEIVRNDGYLPRG